MATKSLKSMMFSLAWTNARNAARAFGGKASEYFAECLKSAHVLNTKEAQKVTEITHTWVNPSNGVKYVYNSYPKKLASGRTGVMQTLHFVTGDVSEQVVGSFLTDLEQVKAIALGMKDYATTNNNGCEVLVSHYSKAA